MKEFLQKMIKSLDLTDEGFSFRKLLCLIIVCLIVYSHIEYITSTNVLTAILYDFGFICVLLGLFNIDRFVAAKWGGDKSLPSGDDSTTTTLLTTVTTKSDDHKEDDPAGEEVAK